MILYMLHAAAIISHAIPTYGILPYSMIVLRFQLFIQLSNSIKFSIIQKKHFTKMQKHVGLASTKNQPNKMELT